jgi:hypothetical protein
MSKNVSRDELPPAKREFVRLLDQLGGDPAAFERLVDTLPGAIDAGCPEQIISGLMLWGAWRGVYPFDRAMQYAVQLGRIYKRGGALDSD